MIGDDDDDDDILRFFFFLSNFIPGFYLNQEEKKQFEQTDAHISHFVSFPKFSTRGGDEEEEEKEG